MKKTGFGYAEPATLDSSPLFGNSPPFLIQMPNPALIKMVAFCLFGKQMALLFLLTTISRRSCKLCLVWGSCWVRQEFGTRPHCVWGQNRTSLRADTAFTPATTTVSYSLNSPTCKLQKAHSLIPLRLSLSPIVGTLPLSAIRSQELSPTVWTA